VGNERTSIPACSKCDGVLRPLVVRTVTVSAGAAEGRELLTRRPRPLTRQGLLTTAIIAALGALADLPIPLLDLAFGAAYLIALAGTYFTLVDHVAHGRAGFPAPVEASTLSSRPLTMRGLLAMLAVFAPVGLWWRWNPGAESVAELLAARPLVSAVIVPVALAWLTAALLAIVSSESGLAAFWPPALVQVVRYAPRAFVGLWGQVALTSLLCWGARGLAAVALGRIPVVAGFSVGAATALCLFGQAALVGGFLGRHREVYSIG
jgi:hypothetical protein